MARKDGIVSRAKSARSLPPLGAIGEDTPLRLNVAAALAYPDGSMTTSGLRREAARGRLVIERTAGKDYTTLGAIRRMRELCRREARGRDYGSDARVAIEKPGNHPTQVPIADVLALYGKAKAASQSRPKETERGALPMAGRPTMTGQRA